MKRLLLPAFILLGYITEGGAASAAVLHIDFAATNFGAGAPIQTLTGSFFLTYNSPDDTSDEKPGAVSDFSLSASPDFNNFSSSFDSSDILVRYAITNDELVRLEFRSDNPFGTIGQNNFGISWSKLFGGSANYIVPTGTFFGTSTVVSEISEVPLPGALLLMLTALGGLCAVARGHPSKLTFALSIGGPTRNAGFKPAARQSLVR